MFLQEVLVHLTLTANPWLSGTVGDIWDCAHELPIWPRVLVHHVFSVDVKQVVAASKGSISV